MALSDPTKAFDVKWLDQKGYFLFCADIIDNKGNGAILRWGYASKENACRTHAFYRVDIIADKSVALSFSEHTKDNDVAPHGRWRFNKTQVEAMRDMRAQVMIARIKAKIGFRKSLEGHIEMGALPRRACGKYLEEGEHTFSPLTGPGEGRVILERKKGGKPDRHFHLQGRAGIFRSAGAFVQGAFVLRAPFAESVRFVHFRAGEAVGIEVDLEGRGREIALTLDGDPSESKFVFREQKGDAFLGVSVLEVSEGVRHVQVRAPMRIPVRAFIVDYLVDNDIIS